MFLRHLLLLALVQTTSAGWSTDFSASNATLWQEATDIEHCNDGACFLARPDHLSFGPAGLVMSLNQSPCNVSSCCVGAKCASWASGKMQTHSEAAYGTYTARLQPAHRAGALPAAANAFSCWTPTYRTTPHHEIAICFSGSDETSVHFSYWYDATAHTTLLYPGFDFGAAMHDYTVVWAPTQIQLLVDGTLAHSVKGTKATIPSLPGYTAIILRPKNVTYIADTYFAAESMSYDEAYDVAPLP